MPVRLSPIAHLLLISNDQDFIFSFREEERSGEIVAPRIFATSYIVTAPNGHGSNYAITIGIEDWPKEPVDSKRCLA